MALCEFSTPKSDPQIVFFKAGDRETNKQTLQILFNGFCDGEIDPYTRNRYITSPHSMDGNS